jgi:Zn-dependent protease
MDQRTKRTLWIVAGVLVVILLVRNNKITKDEVILFCVIVPSIILHEVSHGWVARAFGDDTAARAGRLSLNPIRHVDPIGTLVVPAVMAIGGLGLFGWAKPVPVNPARLRSPRNQGVVVSLAGPFMNMVLAGIGAAVFILVFKTHVYQTGTISTAATVAILFSVANVGLAAFNLIPIPPLDGSVLFERALPARYWPGYLRVRQYTMPIIMGLVLLNVYFRPGPITWLLVHLYNWWSSVIGSPLRYVV